MSSNIWLLDMSIILPWATSHRFYQILELYGPSRTWKLSKNPKMAELINMTSTTRLSKLLKVRNAHSFTTGLAKKYHLQDYSFKIGAPVKIKSRRKYCPKVVVSSLAMQVRSKAFTRKKFVRQSTSGWNAQEGQPVWAQ